MSLLQLAEQPAVDWARFGRFGEAGTYGYQMDASGTDIRNRLMHRELLPATAKVALQTRIRIKSSLVTNNPAFEGLAVKHRGFQMEGATPNAGYSQKWDSSPENQGRRAWISESTGGEYLTFNFVNEIPPGLGIDYVTWELELRAASGRVEIDDVECRYYYGTATMFDMEAEQNFTSGSFGTYFVKGASARWGVTLMESVVDIRKGQSIIAELDCVVTGKAYGVYNSTERIPSKLGLMFRLRRKGTETYEFFTVAETVAPLDDRDINLAGSRQQQAWNNYDKAILVGYVEPDPRSGWASFGGDTLSFNDIQLVLTAADFTGPSQ